MCVCVCVFGFHYSSTVFFSAGWALNIAIGPFFDAETVLAIWHFVHPADRHQLEAWLQAKGCSVYKNNYFVQDHEWDDIKALGIRVQRIAQKCGETVMVPLGAPHQVYNMQGLLSFSLSPWLFLFFA